MSSNNDTAMETASVKAPVAYSATAGSSTAMTTAQAGDCFVQLTATSDCFWSAGPSATTPTSSTGEFLPAGVVIVKKVRPKSIISVVQSTAAGTLYISEQA